ncbi:MAG: DUF4143 domain-containing protein [Patulibacter sp.]
MTYRRRIIDALLDEVFPHLTAVALEGAKGVGKTATGTQRAQSVTSLTDPNERALLAADPSRVTKLPPPVLIDEWQLEPAVWDVVRRAVDDTSGGSRFLLAGSASVPPGTPIHSGAGRIVRVVMRPLAFAERDLTQPTISLRALLDGTQGNITGTSPVTLDDYANEIWRSGFPGIRDLPARTRRLQLDSYLARIVDRELPDSGVTIRRPAALRAWLAAYGAATATTASYTAILNAATAGEVDKPARQTVAIYREHLTRIFVLDPIPAWAPVLAPLRRLSQAPKHHLVDPALAAQLVGITPDDLLRGRGATDSTAGSWLGALFESLTAQSVRVYADAAEARVGHLRTSDTRHEIDLIVERGISRTLAIEVKLSSTVDDHDVRHLHWLKAQLGDRLVDMIVVTTGKHAYRRPDGVAVIPLALLGP